MRENCWSTLNGRWGKCWGGRKWRNKNPLYVFASSLPQWIFEWLRQAFFPRWSPVGETVLPGQINWRASAHRPHRLMKRPRGYLQGHTKEVVWMLTENWALSRMPWVASNYCRPRFQGTITERGLPYKFFFFFLFGGIIYFISFKKWDDYSQTICMFSRETVIISLIPCRPTKRKFNIYSGPQDFYWLHMQAANPQEISIWNHLTATLLQSSPTMRHLDF